jgi:hypothetical protein
MKREYLTVYERRRKLREAFRWWRDFGIVLGLLMLVAFEFDQAIVGAWLGLCALGAFGETARIRAKLERGSRV